MVFSSHLFLYYFLPLALAVYYLSPRRAQHLLLTTLSYLFYGWANPAFTLLMAASTVVDYLCGLTIAGAFGQTEPEPLPTGDDRTRRQRTALGISIVTNLALLGFFKYFNFATDSYDSLVTAVGLAHLGLDSVLRVTLPLGISFYTFQSMSYTIDVYRGKATALSSLVDFACYVSLFPQLVAGPIIRFSEIAEQLRSRRHTFEKFSRGIAFVSLGLAKKVLLANPCGKMADVAFDAAARTPLDAWTGLTAYSFQIYFDFSGYSDIAIGLGLMLGFVFPKNFDSPYRAVSITDFWRRWHISLSSWLRDYLYLPLGGNRRGQRRTYVNLAIVMLLGGLWHGAAWNFVVWGGWHGALLALERMRGKRGALATGPRALQMAATYGLVLLGWVFFRAESLGRAVEYLGHLVGLGPVPPGAVLLDGLLQQPYYLVTLVVAASVIWSAPQTWDWTRRLPAWKAVCILTVFWTALVALATQSYNPFIYFIF